MTLVITFAGLLLTFSFVKSLDIAQFFDQVRIKEYRLMNYYNADSCIDQAILSLAHDYFYRVSSSTSLVDFNCSIDIVYEESGQIVIQVTGNYKGINVKKSARVNLFDNRLEVIKKL